MIISLQIRLPSGSTYPTRHQGEVLRIGRNPECDVDFTDDLARGVSWEHAQVTLEQGNAYLTDLGSSNGTFLNDNRIAGKQPLRVGDEIGLGQQGPKLKVTELNLQRPDVSGSASSAGGAFGFLGPEARSSGQAVASPNPVVPIQPRPSEAPRQAPSQPRAVDSHKRDKDDDPPKDKSTRALLVDFCRTQQQRWVIAGVVAAALLFAVLVAFLATSYRRPGENDISWLVEQAGPSVVRVETDTGVGSGFLLDDKGTVVTNHHVVNRATEAQIVFSDGLSTEVAGFTAVSVGKDLVFLRPRSTARLPSPLPLASSPPPDLSNVVAFGSPLGFDNSESQGTVSEIRKGDEVAEILLKMTGEDIYRDRQGYDDDAIWIQSTATILHGNSGGPLVNLRGEVVGVNTWGPADTLNFSISAACIRELQKTATDDVRPLSQIPVFDRE